MVESIKQRPQPGAQQVSRLAGWRILWLLLPILLLQVPAARSVSAQSCVPYPAPQARFGFNVARDGNRTIEQYDITPLKAHWYLDYITQVTPAQPTGIAYAQMIRPPLWKSSTFTTTVGATLQANPGALWILGNEPDRDKQDGLTPAQYAVFYHDVYTFLKARDPSATIAIAGVVQSTPLRRRYLDMILTEYQNRYGQPMPIDVWTMHAFILAENSTIWGAWNPPGLEEYAHEGIQYNVTDHDNLTVFKANVRAFRQWMAERGYRDKPLLVTEYGILLSPLHGFPYEKVRTFMLGSFDYFLTATDTAIGYPADSNRLVQAWSWFSLNYPPYDLETGFGHNGNLVEPDTGALLALGQDFGNYISALPSADQVKLTLPSLQLTPPVIVITPTVTTTQKSRVAPGTIPEITPARSKAGGTIPNTPLTFQATLSNSGNNSACNLTIHLWHRDPAGAVTRIETQMVTTLPAAGQGRASHSNGAVLTFTWDAGVLAPGLHELIIEAEADNAQTSLPTAQIQQNYRFHVVGEPFTNFTYLPIAEQ